MGNPWGKPQGFLDDYSNITAASGAVQGFFKGLQDMEDRSLKRMEVEAKMKSYQSEQERHAEEIAIKKRTAETAEFAAGAMRGGDGKLVTNPNSIKALHEDNQAAITGRREDRRDKSLGLQERRFGETQSQNAAAAGKTLQDDSLVKEFEKSRANLARGRSLLNGETPLTYNNINAVQQDIISALSSGGVSSEGKVNREMQESYKGRWNNLMAKMGKYGADNDIRKQDPGLAAQVGALLDEVDSAVAKNSADRKKKLGSVYGQHSNQKVKATIRQQLSDDGGLVPQGMVSPGLVKAAPAKAAPAAAHPEANAAEQWARANPTDPRAQEILKRLGQ